jgi:hypothetical protein
MGIFLFSRVLSSRKNKFNFSNWWGKWEGLGLWNSALTSVAKVNAQSVLGWIFLYSNLLEIPVTFLNGIGCLTA